MRDVLYCPGCERRLQLPDDAYGKKVQCPSCQRVFTAEPNLTNPPTAMAKVATGPAPVPQRRDYDAGEIDRPRGRRRDDDDEYDRSRGSRRPAPHRGGEVLTFGLLGLIPCVSFIFGPIAWLMANADLHEMRMGRMDRNGEGLTQAGRALGIVGLVLWLVFFSIICISMQRI